MKTRISLIRGKFGEFPGKSGPDCWLTAAFGKANAPKTGLQYGNMKARGVLEFFLKTRSNPGTGIWRPGFFHDLIPAHITGSPSETGTQTGYWGSYW